MTIKPAPALQWADEALDSSDISGRPGFARAIAARIDTCTDGQGSTVFGLVGPWGSGKTTLLKDITQHLESWTCIWFSPWSAVDVASITSEFLSALSEAFPKSKPIKKRIVSYSRFGAPMLKLIPVIGDTASALAAEAMAARVVQPAWHTEFTLLSEQIAEEHKRVLVIVDDVDRLDTDELRALLRVVRLLGRFTNIHYLIAYDQETIDAVLNAEGVVDGNSRFMEKIVQYPFEVPPTPMVIRRRWSREVLDLITPISASDAEYTDRRERLVQALALGLETPRSAGRLREQLASLSVLASEAEVDMLDFAALTWLRIAHHQVWNDIRLNSRRYLGWKNVDSEDVRAARKRDIDGLVTGGHSRPVGEVLSFLFESDGRGLLASGREGRLKTERYFERYFHIGLADDDVSERIVATALADLVRGETDSGEVAYLTDVILGADEGRSSLALDFATVVRQRGQAPSEQVLDYVSDMRSKIKSLKGTSQLCLPQLERWLAREIFLVLQGKTIPVETVIHNFGYSFVVSGAYALTRTTGRAERSMETYGVIVERWIAEVSSETLGATLARQELIPMTSFCQWLTTVQEGFLSGGILGIDAFIDAAIQFVSFNEWVGRGVKFEAVFRESEFRFAVSEIVCQRYIKELPQIDGEVLEYEVSDLPAPFLPANELRDFAIRGLHNLKLA